MQRPLTDAFLRSMKPPPTGRLEISDVRCAGLVFRVTPNGIKSWSFRFRATGRLARATIGQYPAIGLTAARARADAMRQEVAAGGNPAERRRQDRAGAGTKTFSALAERYLAEHARRKKRSHKADERNLRKHVLPYWGNRAYAGIKRADVIERLEALVTAGKPTLANRVQSLISSVFTFAMDADLVEANPCHRLRKRGIENIGYRVLSDDEIRLFWPGVVETPRSRHTGLGLRLALLTAARVFLLELLEPEQQFLFPTRSRRGGAMQGNSLTQAMDYFSGRVAGELSDNLSRNAGEAMRTWKLDPPTPHDLRRTVETRLAELRVPKEIRDRVLNHIPSDVGSKHYNRHDYADEKRAALTRWSAAISSILGGRPGGSVIDLATARRDR